MSYRALSFGLSLLCGAALAAQGRLNVPITPFSNMESGYQATNPGFRLILKDSSGQFLAGGPLTMEAVINGYADDASSGTPYGKLVLSMDIAAASPAVNSMSGSYQGLLSICMAKDANRGPPEHDVAENLRAI